MYVCTCTHIKREKMRDLEYLNFVGLEFCSTYILYGNLYIHFCTYILDHLPGNFPGILLANCFISHTCFFKNRAGHMGHSRFQGTVSSFSLFSPYVFLLHAIKFFLLFRPPCLREWKQIHHPLVRVQALVCSHPGTFSNLHKHSNAVTWHTQSLVHFNCAQSFQQERDHHRICRASCDTRICKLPCWLWLVG